VVVENLRVLEQDKFFRNDTANRLMPPRSMSKARKNVNMINYHLRSQQTVTMRPIPDQKMKEL
jgi:hypothetical protein